MGYDDQNLWLGKACIEFIILPLVSDLDRSFLVCFYGDIVNRFLGRQERTSAFPSAHVPKMTDRGVSQSVRSRYL